MTPRRSGVLVLAVAATAMLVTGSAGFTSVSADRGVSVAVVDADDAYVGVSVCSNPASNESTGGHPVDVTVANQFSEPFTVETIAWSDDAHPKETEKSPDETLQPGESVTFTDTFGTDEVTVTVSGGLDATVTVDVGPQCTGGTANGMRTTETT